MRRANEHAWVAVEDTDREKAVPRRLEAQLCHLHVGDVAVLVIVIERVQVEAPLGLGLDEELSARVRHAVEYLVSFFDVADRLESHMGDTLDA